MYVGHQHWVKYLGRGEHLLSDGRFFAYYSSDEIEQFLANAGFAIDQLWMSKDSLRPERQIRWLNIIAHRETRLHSSRAPIKSRR